MKITYYGRIYDTATAGKLLWRCNDAENDFDYCEEWLCITPSGDYFLAGHGGARTKYAHRLSDGSFCGGDDIIPLTEQEMEIWIYDRYDNFADTLKTVVEKSTAFLKEISDYIGYPSDIAAIKKHFHTKEEFKAWQRSQLTAVRDKYIAMDADAFYSPNHTDWVIKETYRKAHIADYNAVMRIVPVYPPEELERQCKIAEEDAAAFDRMITETLSEWGIPEEHTMD